MEPQCESAKLRKTQETLSTLPLSGVVLRPRDGRPMQRRAQLLAAIFAAISANSAVIAQPGAILCVPPEVPAIDLPRTVLVEYRTEITVEFETYFTNFSDYILCLDDERTRALVEARVATDAYSTFLNTLPASKDLP